MTHINLPTDILSAHGETADEIVQYLREEGWVRENEVVVSLNIKMKADDIVAITNIGTRKEGQIGSA